MLWASVQYHLDLLKSVFGDFVIKVKIWFTLVRNNPYTEFYELDSYKDVLIILVKGGSYSTSEFIYLKTR